MNVGDEIECSIWLDGRETPAQRARFEADVKDALLRRQKQVGVIIGPITWAEKRPGDERVPPVPGHIAGPDVKLLVAEAKVVGRMPVLNNVPGFVHDLEPDDLALLRTITRRKYEQEYPGRPRLTDRQCDTLINDLGPQAAVDALKSLRRSDRH